MYDELVALLRSLSELSTHCECYESCGECDKQDICDTFTNESIITKAGEAADAIEELQGRAKVLEKVADKWCAAVPKWIPATERLPEKRKYVLVRYKNNDMAVACWFDGDEDILFWRAMTDEGLCADCDTDPTHWMPLPQAPKEET